MKLFVYTISVFIISFILQIFLLILIERKKRNKLNELTIEAEYKINIKFATKIILALLISIVLAVVTFYGLGIYILYELRKWH